MTSCSWVPEGHDSVPLCITLPPECIEKSHISGRRRRCGGRGRACGGRGRACGCSVPGLPPVSLRVAAVATQRRLSLVVGSGRSLRKPTLATAWSPRPHLWTVGEEGKQSAAMRRSRGAGDASSWVPGGRDSVPLCITSRSECIGKSGISGRRRCCGERGRACGGEGPVVDLPKGIERGG
jgi:hypothetical protein